jgi:hypothetical protein
VRVFDKSRLPQAPPCTRTPVGFSTTKKSPVDHCKPSCMHRIKRMQTLCAPHADILSSTSAHQSNPPHPLLGLSGHHLGLSGHHLGLSGHHLGLSGHHRTLRTATKSTACIVLACMCRKPFSTTCGHVMGPFRNLRSLLSIAVMAIAQLCPSPLCGFSVQGVEASSSRLSLTAVCL